MFELLPYDINVPAVKISNAVGEQTSPFLFREIGHNF